MAFANNKKVKLIASMVDDDMAYIKGSKSYFSQDEVKGKKFGQTVSGYLADPGTVHDGIVASPDAIAEIEISATMQNKNSSCELDLWNEFTDIEDFAKEIAEPRAKNLALSAQKAIMDANMIRSCQAVVATSAGFGLLTKSAKALDELGVAGKKLSFQSPNIMGDIAESGLSRFIPTEQMKKIYDDAYLGQYAGAAQIEIANTPVIDTTDQETAPTITLTAVTDSNSNNIGCAAIKAAVSANNSKKFIKGGAYSVSGLYIRNAAGQETNQPFVIIIQESKNGGSGVTASIPEIRIAAAGTGYNNANAWMSQSALDSAITTGYLTLTPMLTGAKHYAVGQCRTETALGFDQYRFGNLPGSENSDVATAGNVTIKMGEFGDGKNGVKLVRLDFPFVAKIFDVRESVTTYLLLD